MQQRSRSPAFLDAVPDRPSGEGAEREAGSFVPASKDDGIRCPNRKCRKKLAEELEGKLTITCRHCGHRVIIIC